MDFFLSQFFCFLGAIGIGFLMGVLWDIFCGFRIKWFSSARYRMILDLLWWLLITGVVFFLLLLLNWGELRVYLFLGIVTGVLFYYKKLSSGFSKLFLAFLHWIEKTLKKMVRILLLPLKILKKILLWPIGLLLLVFHKVRKGLRRSGEILLLLLKVIPRKSRLIIKKNIIPRGRNKK
ncbi:MAG: spore cortex biosynthesis protein YabQ [Dehalobacterium sp.]|jgi:spore cortex biosynthesis protein YabQ